MIKTTELSYVKTLKRDKALSSSLHVFPRPSLPGSSFFQAGPETNARLGQAAGPPCLPAARADVVPRAAPLSSSPFPVWLVLPRPSVLTLDGGSKNDSHRSLQRRRRERRSPRREREQAWEWGGSPRHRRGNVRPLLVIASFCWAQTVRRRNFAASVFSCRPARSTS